jgi:hypothetical protein
MEAHAMTPEQIETYAAIGGAAVAVLGGPAAVKAGLAWWAGYRERRARAREALAEREAEHDERTEQRLWQRVETLERRSDECGEALAEAQSLAVQSVQVLGEVKAEIAECRRDREDQSRELAELRRKVDRASADITQRVELAAEKVARRSPPPPKPRGDGS